MPAQSTVNVTITAITTPPDMGGVVTCSLSLPNGTDPNIKLNPNSSGVLTIVELTAPQNTAVQVTYNLANPTFGGYVFKLTQITLSPSAPPWISIGPDGVSIIDQNTQPPPAPGKQPTPYEYSIYFDATAPLGGGGTCVWDPPIENENTPRPPNR